MDIYAKTKTPDHLKTKQMSNYAVKITISIKISL